MVSLSISAKHPRIVQELDALKKQGNEAFKAGEADLAFLHYNQAQVP